MPNPSLTSFLPLYQAVANEKTPGLPVQDFEPYKRVTFASGPGNLVVATPIPGRNWGNSELADLLCVPEIGRFDG